MGETNRAKCVAHTVCHFENDAMVVFRVDSNDRRGAEDRDGPAGRGARDELGGCAVGEDMPLRTVDLDLRERERLDRVVGRQVLDRDGHLAQ